ncbi:WAP four-disulfide core domain protein 18-like isoform X2 [Solea senegalensis]|uniref:WAP four-disulfide core domain protein 18-like isoform X2 n=1 Tax=Solea senegalensis TaxID=28829 RepID=A0AAV6SQS7_SOLSE|nr:WAP four-disulfide core domain protein 3 [Solea senegalensis]KAG7519405.1 WAP four-disulfide core domain protein 18-like isoform X2 [Solea senegalensis]
MEKHWSAVCALILVLGVYVHLDTAFAADTERSVTENPGKCPKRNWGMGLCAEFCTNDCDCPSNKKCCSNGCGHECMVPEKEKPGNCPLRQGTQLCAEFCYHDGECPGAEKCCKTTCGHACSEPC